VLLTVAVGWTVLVSLPGNPYLRYVWLEDTDYVKGRWIYERLHFDPTPVDVAFVGSSHTLIGVDSATVERVAAGDGPPTLHVANLALPHYGRDVDDLLTDMLLATKHPRLLVVEADYIEYRAPHPAFPLIADARDLWDAPVLVNWGLLDDIVFMGRRRFGETLASLLGEQPRFDPGQYRGTHWSDSYRPNGRNYGQGPVRTTHEDATLLARESVADIRDQQQKQASDARHFGLETRYHEIYLRRLIAAAHAAGTRVVFLYLPIFGAPPRPIEADALERMAEIWTPPAAITHDPTLWGDIGHLNYAGAEQLSTWLGEKLRARIETAAAPTPTVQ
ncbi:MAG: hypothetical protein JO326_08670, partial [Acetobacteraceae bacterium]|nr:hypothetical protein [Acetobacteraceae bacterium]